MPNRQEIGTIDDPSFVWFEAGDETYLELQDADGNTIVRFNQDESISNVSSFSTEILSTDWVLDAASYASIQAALDDAATQNVGVVIVPPGTYNQSSTLTIPQGVTLRGLGNTGTDPQVTISGNSGVDPVISCAGTEAGSIGLYGVSVSVDSTEDAFNGDLLNSVIWNCRFPGGPTVTITSDGGSNSQGGRFINNNMVGGDITADSGVSASFLINGNVRTGTITSNSATTGTNT